MFANPGISIHDTLSLKHNLFFINRPFLQQFPEIIFILQPLQFIHIFQIVAQINGNSGNIVIRHGQEGGVGTCGVDIFSLGVKNNREIVRLVMVEIDFIDMDLPASFTSFTDMVRLLAVLTLMGSVKVQGPSNQ